MLPRLNVKTLLRLWVITLAVSVLPLSGAAGDARSVSLFSLSTQSVFALRMRGKSAQEKIRPEALEDTAGGQPAPVLVMLADQPDLSAAYSIEDADVRGWYVYYALTQHAEVSQAALRELLARRGVAFRSFWAANFILVEADRSLLEELAARDDVAYIDSNRPMLRVEPPEPVPARSARRRAESPGAIEWGVQNVNAPSVWGQGFNGQGMVIGVVDTGVRWTHTALKPQYRGWNGATADHNYNWRDAIHSGGGSCGSNTVAPCDDYGHGSHVTGTAAGSDGGTNQIGVAPGAKWIGCRSMDQGVGTPATYTECFQFMIAPTDLAGNNANPSLRPHVINHSAACPPSEGCAAGTLETVVNNVQAAGILFANAAGNEGPACSTVNDPPAIYAASFSVGAHDIANGLAGFSSRGPATFYDPDLLKPNLTAPGVNVRSATNSTDTSYRFLSGTSMASPHVAGVVALLWSARHSLVRDVSATRTRLEQTANRGVVVAPQNCGGTPSTQIPNNSFGYGRIDASAAVGGTLTAGSVSLSGRVLTATGRALRGAVLVLTDPAGAERFAPVERGGLFRFDDVESGQTYVLSLRSQRFTMDPQVVTLQDSISGLELVAAMR